jgi:hypothetical protein
LRTDSAYYGGPTGLAVIAFNAGPGSGHHRRRQPRHRHDPPAHLRHPRAHRIVRTAHNLHLPTAWPWQDPWQTISEATSIGI